MSEARVPSREDRARPVGVLRRADLAQATAARAKDPTAYDAIGTDYATKRLPDPRWAKQILDALGTARSIVNVGAGTGSYEPTGKRVVAVEPSETMIRQRPAGSAPVIRGVAEELPFEDGAFDAGMAVLTVHHWSDIELGVRELRRVSRRQVVLTYDCHGHADFWLTDYIPEIAAFESKRAPRIELLARLLGTEDVRTLRVPADMRDGVLAANWCRPEAYLDPTVRAACSGLAQLSAAAVAAGVERLREDLWSGAWDRRYGALREQPSYDAGYRLLIAEATAAGHAR